jgi:drug/metabolite transporter, DME family
MKEHRKGIIAVFITALLWSTGGLFIKLISLNAMQLSFFRCLVAAIVFSIIFNKKVFRINRLGILNALFYAVVLITFVLATKTTTAANAIFLQSTAPIYVFLFEPLINKTAYRKIDIVTILVCIGGMFLFFTGEISPGHFEGNLIALLSGAAFASFFLGMKRNKPEFQLSSIFYGNVIVTLICLPFIFSLEFLSASDIWMVTYLGVFQIGLAYAIFSYGLKRVFAIEASLISLVEPVLNPVWVFFGYGEIPSTTAIMGGIIIITAITARTLITELPVFKGMMKRKNNVLQKDDEGSNIEE